MESEIRLRQRKPNPIRLDQPLHPEQGRSVRERRYMNIANLEAKLLDPRISLSFTPRQRERRIQKLAELKQVD